MNKDKIKNRVELGRFFYFRTGYNFDEWVICDELRTIATTFEEENAILVMESLYRAGVLTEENEALKKVIKRQGLQIQGAS